MISETDDRGWLVVYELLGSLLPDAVDDEMNEELGPIPVDEVDDRLDEELDVAAASERLPVEDEVDESLGEFVEVLADNENEDGISEVLDVLVNDSEGMDRETAEELDDRAVDVARGLEAELEPGRLLGADDLEIRDMELDRMFVLDGVSDGLTVAVS